MSCGLTAEKRAASVIGHYLTAQNMAENVPGMGKFAEFWTNRQPSADRDLIRFFESELKRIPGEVATALESDDGAST